MQHRIGGPDQRLTRQAVLLVFEVKHDRALVAVQRVEVAALAVCERLVVAPRIAAGRLDLDHVGAEVGEQHAGKRPRHVLGVLEHPDPIQRQWL